MMVWQAPERNGWDVTIRQSLGAAEGPVAVPSGLPDPFSLADPHPTAAERAVGRLREALATHFSDDGVWFNSRAWVVTARRR
jgi:hypothetical protein